MSNTWAAFGTFPAESGESNVQSSIRRGLTYLSERDQSIFGKKFKAQSADELQVMHTYRELLVGVFMARQGLTLRYEPNIDGLTPDWHFQRGGSEAGIADLVNFHVERKIDEQIERELHQGGTWSGEIPDQSRRLRASLGAKAGKYEKLAAEKSVPYIVFIFGWMNAVVQPHQVKQCLLELFHDCPTLSGVYNMYQKGNCLADSTAGYGFDYYANATASHPANFFTNGTLPYEFAAFCGQLT